MPIWQWAGFTRIHLAPGQTETVTFTLTPRQLSLINGEGQRVIEPGEFQIAIGGCQPGADSTAQERTLHATFEVIAHAR